MGLNRNLGNIPEIVTVFNNNFGIGTNTAAEKLDVNGTSIFRGIATFGGNINVVDNNVLNLGYNQGGGATLKYNSNGNLDITPRSGYSTVFTSGNVGIGTTSPSALFTLGSLYSVEMNINSSTPRINFLENSVYTGELKSQSGVVTLANSSNNALAFATNGSERMRVTSGGNVGIGNGANVNSRLHVEGQDIYLTGALDNRIRFANFGFTGNSMGAAIGYAYGAANTQEQGNLVFYTNPNTTGTPSLTERMRITSSGNLLLRTTTDSGYQCTMNTTAGNLFYFTLGSGNVQMFMGSNSDFYISTNNSQGVKLPVGATSWSAYSDIRLKNVTGKITNATSDVNTLSAIKFRLKSDLTNKDRVGLVAQEVQKVLPEAVDEDEKGMLSVRYTELIPLLVASIQELTERIKILESK